LTVPFPVPEPPELIVIHVLLLVALQPQPAVAVTLALSALPPAAADTDDCDTVKSHDDAVPSCVTVTVRPAMVSVPVRGAVPAFAATL